MTTNLPFRNELKLDKNPCFGTCDSASARKLCLSSQWWRRYGGNTKNVQQVQEDIVTSGHSAVARGSDRTFNCHKLRNCTTAYLDTCHPILLWRQELALLCNLSFGLWHTVRNDTKLFMHRWNQQSSLFHDHYALRVCPLGWPTKTPETWSRIWTYLI